VARAETAWRLDRSPPGGQVLAGVRIVFRELGMDTVETCEDCLYLNVWTPAKSAKDRLPVMVWIYGGGFSIGGTSIALYNGANLAKKGVVRVSVGHRVGALGFMAHRR
jgi:carboxylesterase type B